MQQFLDLAAKYGLAIFSDEIYLKMCHDKREHVTPVQLASDASVLVMTGLAKLAGVPGYGFEWLGLPGLQVCESTAAMFAILRRAGQSPSLLRGRPALLQRGLQPTLAQARPRHLQRRERTE